MFSINKTVKAFKKDFDSFSTPYDSGEVSSEIKSVKARSGHPAFRIAVCSVVAAAVVLTGTLVIPGIYSSSKSRNSFEIMVKADGVTKALTSDQPVNLPADNKPYTGTVGNITDCFTVQGDNVDSVTYTTEDLRLEHVSDKYQQEIKSIKPYCSFTIPKSEFKTSDLFAEFNQMWDSGELDQYKNQFFNSEDINPSVYNVGFQYDTNSDTVKVIISKLADMVNPQDDDLMTNNTFTVPVDDQSSVLVMMSNSEETPTSFDISVKATFKDGTTQTKTVSVEFDSIGMPYLKLDN